MAESIYYAAGLDTRVLCMVSPRVVCLHITTCARFLVIFIRQGHGLLQRPRDRITSAYWGQHITISPNIVREPLILSIGNLKGFEVSAFIGY